MQKELRWQDLQWDWIWNDPASVAKLTICFCVIALIVVVVNWLNDST